jgi:LPXTG-motif cell wall-anchored protein
VPELPRTGSAAMPLTVAGLAFMALGAVAIGFERRRGPVRAR